VSLQPHQIAFLDQRNVLIIETGRYLIMMWLCAS
jgi:hypothetical protein